MRSHFYLILLFAAILLFTGCLNNSDDPVFYNNVEGTVLSGGEPLPDAHIHIRNHFEPGGFMVSEEDDEVTIDFNVPQRALFSGDLYRFGSDSSFASFLDDTLEAVEQSILIPDSLLSNGIFEYIIQNDLGQGFSGLLSINKPDSLIIDAAPYTVTNSAGEFTLRAFNMAFGRQFSSAESGSFEITDSLEIIVVTGDSIFTKQRVKVQPNEDNFFEITGQ